MTAAGKTLMPGAVGKTVVRNVEDLRRARNFSLRALSERLAAIGHPLITSAVHAISQGKRRVDADDLLALSLALGVNPNALLLPRDDAPGAEVELSPGVRQRAWAAWAWADGRMPLPAGQDGGETAGERFGREVDFTRHARPAFSAHDQAEAVFEVYELADRIEAWRGATDPAIRDMLWDRVVRQLREVAHKLEEQRADDRLREVVQSLPAPAVDYAEPSGQAEEKR